MRAVLNDHIYVPTPGDHYSAFTGSAIMTLIYEFTRKHIEAGGRSRIIVGRNTRHDYPAGEQVLVDFGPGPDKLRKVADVALGWLDQPRYYINRSYAPAAQAVSPDFEGILFIQNTPGPVRMFRERSPKALVCINVHNELFNTYGARELRRTTAATDLLICNCHFLANLLLERMEQDQEKVRVVHNGVDTERFVPRPELVSREEVSILFVARMVPTKGADLLIQAAAKLHAGGKRFKLRIVGNQGFNANDPLSPYEVKLRQMAAPMGDAVEFLPFMDRHKILPVYQSASIFCAPSNYNEPCTLTVPESMACGRPVVASDRGGIPEIGKDAILYFNPPDTDELADRLADLIDSESLREEYGRRARARAQELDWSIQYQAQREALGAEPLEHSQVLASLPHDHPLKTPRAAPR